MRHLLTITIVLTGPFIWMSAHAQFSVPLDGIQGHDWFLANYVDRDPDSISIRDYRCGSETYDGHQGTDFVIRDFRQMDSGVTVRAVMSGRVYLTRDGLFDRSKQADTGDYGNFVSINHGDSLFTVYGHLRKNSLKVVVGDSVSQGEPIGLVGSSGKAEDPHCHFEVWHNGLIVDPFGDSCIAGHFSSGMFAERPFYDDNFAVISVGIASGNIGLDSIRERPISISSLSSQDSFITFWVHGLSMHIGDSTRVDWIAPGNTLWYSYTYTFTSYNRYWYDWTYIDGPARRSLTPGQWFVSFHHNDSLVARTSFYVPQLGIQRASIRSVLPLASPNPASHSIRIAANPRATIAIFDALGREVTPIILNLQQNERTIDCTALPEGAYTVIVREAESVRSEKFVRLR